MCEKTKTLVLWCLVALFATCLAWVLHPATTNAATGINQQISFEGKLVSASGVNIADGTYNMEFKIYSGGTGTSGSGGTLVWTEDRLISASTAVTVSGGTFQVNLGSVTSLSAVNFNTDTLWLSMQVGSTTSCTITTTFQSNCSGDGEMSPYIRFTAVPYAMNALTVGGLGASSLVQLSPGSQQSGAINVSGNIQTGGTLQTATIDTPSSGTLTVGSTNTSAITLSQNVTVTSGKSLIMGGATVINGSGIVQTGAVSGSYTGINGVGTLTVGTWNGTTIAANYGGTGQSSYTVGDLLYAPTTTTLGALHDVATGSCLISGGTGVAPGWGSCGSSSSANAALSNLASVAINTSLLPGANNAIDAGSASFSFRSGYFGTSLYAPSIDTVASGTLAIGGTNATTITVGMMSGSTSQTFNVGGNSGNNTININTGAGTNVTNIGSSGDTTSIYGGSSSEILSPTGETLQSTINSSTAFAIQNAAGVPVFLVDTSTSLSGNYLTYGGFEVGSTTPTGWSSYGSPTTFSRNTAAPNHYGGLASLQLGTSAANQGATTTSFNSVPANQAYTVSFYALQTAGTTLASTNFSTIVNGGTAAACTTGITLSSSGFQRISCLVAAPGAAITSLTIESTASTSATLYIDAVQMVAGTNPTPATNGAIQLRGAIDNPAVFQALSNSTTAFQIQNTAGNSNLLVADTLDTRIGINTSAVPGATLSVGGTTGNFQVTNAGVVSGGTYNGATIGATTFNATTLTSNSLLFTGGATTINAGGSAITIGSTGSGVLNLNAVTYTTATKGVQIGSSTASTTPTLLELNQGSLASGSETSGSCTTTINDGAMYYNTSSGAMRACINGNWEDMLSTAGLGILAFGVLPDSGNAGAPGDIAGVSSYTNSPCKITWASATSVQVNACIVYSGSHKIIVATQSISTAGVAASSYANICFSAANGTVSTSSTPTVLTASATETSATLPTFSANNPVECLARIKTTTTAGTVGNIWDTRTFINTQKEFIALNSVNQPGYLMVGSTTADAAVTTATPATGPIAGIVVASAGTASSTTINGIIAVSGDAFVSRPATSPADTVNTIVESTSTAGYAQTVASNASATVYAYAGILERAADTTCTAATNCQFSGLVRLNISR